MGVSCNKYLNSDDQKEIVFVNDRYKDLKFTKYISSFDEYYKSFEDKVNLLKYINIIEFSYSLSNFEFDSTEESKLEKKKSSLFIQYISSDKLSIFIENKIIKHPSLYELDIEPEAKGIFSEFFSGLFDKIRKGNISYCKINNTTDKNPKKFFLLAIAILLCGGDNLAKLDIIFSTFANNVNKLEKNSLNFRIYIFLKFLTASYAILQKIDDFSVRHPDYFQFNYATEEKNQIYEKYQFDKIYKLTDVFIKEFFGNATSLSYEEYLNKIINDGHDWFLTSPGIRLQILKIENTN